MKRVSGCMWWRGRRVGHALIWDNMADLRGLAYLLQARQDWQI